MIATQKSKQRYTSMFATISLVLIFFILLSNFQSIRYPTFVQEEYRDEKNPGTYVKYLHPVPSNASYCKFNYGLPHQLVYTAEDISGSPELGNESPFYILYDAIEGRVSGDVPSVTYATHITANFAVYISELVRYWEGPISVAAFIRDGDLHVILQQFIQFCYCIPEMSRLSLHLVLKKETNVDPNSVFIPSTDCDIQDLSKVESRVNLDSSVQTPASTSWYPINVCRNVARNAAYTKYVMVTDIELMPSYGLATRFIKLTKTYKCNIPECARRVFVVPVFEIDATENIPRAKKQLVEMIHREKAVYFHRLICVHCQKFPGLEQWMESDPGDEVKPFLVTKREVPFHRWEPVYIGTKNEPFYNERLSWEGFQDKMLQMLEMCLKKYKLVILDGAFLVHWPGIKKGKSNNVDPWRIPFMQINQRQYDLILKNISSKYIPNLQCKIK